MADSICDDGAYCNGPERCAPADPAADARGCVSGAAPCTGADVCDEATESCGCSGITDMDGDGSDSRACGGDDCDDSDPRRHPGAPEICDAAGLDEDCDPTTLGPDADDDGAIMAGCCNLQADASLLCGTDCNDDNLNVAPGAPEICDGLDNDCSGSLSFPGEDDDGDGFADCMDLPAGMRDCDDTRDTVYPGAPEICDGQDSDCNGVRPPGDDEDGDGFASMTSTCTGGLPRTDCDDANRAASPGWTREACDGVDNDCDSRVDESCTGHCDPVADANIGDPMFLTDTLAACSTTCGGDDGCVDRCLRTALVATATDQCEVCFDPLFAAVTAIGRSCRARLSDADCRASLCSVGHYIAPCTGLLFGSCGGPDCDEAYQRYRRCADGPCADATCERECAAPATPWCRSCLAALQTCEASSCAAACSDHESYGCDACLRTSCLPAYETCIGGDIPAPSCTSAEAMALYTPSGPPADICADSCFDMCPAGGTSCLLGCGNSCIRTAAGPPEPTTSCLTCYYTPAFCRDDAESGTCAAECATAGAACDACVCEACEVGFMQCSGFASARCRG